MKFQLHNPTTAPAASQPILENIAAAYGFTPNLYAVFAESPVALSTYVAILDALKQHAALSPAEQQVVMLAVSAKNRCDYCVAAHTMVGGRWGVAPETIAAIRDGKAPSDRRDAALVSFAHAVMSHAGWVPESAQQAFLEAGFTGRHILDILTILAMKTLSNYTNHIAQTPLDSAFAPHRWTPTTAA